MRIEPSILFMNLCQIARRAYRFQYKVPKGEFGLGHAELNRGGSSSLVIVGENERAIYFIFFQKIFFAKNLQDTP